MRTPATHHLTHEQLCDVLLALPSEKESRTIAAAHDHLRDCLVCSAELENLRDSLSLFRQAAHSYAGQLYSRPSINKTSIAPSPRYASHVLYWAIAAVIAVAIALPLGLNRQHSPAPQSPAAAITAPAQASESDEALLEGIAQDLSTDVPSSMQPLADPTAGAATAQTTSDRRKN